MKRKLSRLLMCLYFSIVLLVIFICVLIDNTGALSFKVVLPVCLAILIISMICYCVGSKSNETLVDNVSEKSYAVINDETYSIDVYKVDEELFSIKLTRKKEN